MKICFIGMGSIGTRHLRNITTILKEQNILFSIDVLRSSKIKLSDEKSELICKQYYNYYELPNDYDIIFITNPTYLHFDTIKNTITNTKNMFIEKPIFESCNYDLKNLFINTDGIYYVACPLRYSTVMKYIKKIIQEEKIYSIRAISSSYLPDWRKGIDYRNIYSSKKEYGGGASLDLIHEWDYITYLFGEPMEVYNMNGKYSELEIDSDDISIYIARYHDKLLELHVDYIGRNTVRQLELYCKDHVIYADFIHNTITYKGENQKTIQLEKEDMYMNEMRNFLDIINHKVRNDNDIFHAYNILKIATNNAQLEI